MTSPWGSPSVSWPDLCPTRLMSFRPVVLCSGCWRSPGRSSWGLQATAARRPPAFYSTTLPPPTRRVIAATLGRRRGWEWVQVYFGYLCSGVQSQQRCFKLWERSDRTCFIVSTGGQDPRSRPATPARHVDGFTVARIHQRQQNQCY